VSKKYVAKQTICNQQFCIRPFHTCYVNVFCVERASLLIDLCVVFKQRCRI